MGVLMQAFYWDCPRLEQKEHAWWNEVRARVPALAAAGFTSLWLPPVHKAASVTSMGYDPYDYYDLGEHDQKGGVATWFGTRAELLALVHDAHANRLTLLADLVINHCSGADAQEVNPLTGTKAWTRFTPKSGKFERNWDCFHPSRYETWDDGAFGGMPDLAHRNPRVYRELLELARWLVEDVGFDGFRYDFVKGYGTWTVTAIQEYRYRRAGKALRPFGVGEDWDGERTIANWTTEVNAWTDNPVSAFDFPLHYTLKALCDEYGFSLRELATRDSVSRAQPSCAVTFVENHDLRDGGDPIMNDKLLAYAYVLTHEGSPCVFWKDYFTYGLAKEGTPNGIAALVAAHERYASGETDIIAASDDFYAMLRAGAGANTGLVLALNNRGDRWNGEWVSTRWPNARLVPVAWWSASDLARPDDQPVAPDGRAQVWAPPRGYAVYVPV